MKYFLNCGGVTAPKAYKYLATADALTANPSIAALKAGKQTKHRRDKLALQLFD